VSDPRPLILIVDDNPADQRALGRCLRRQGYVPAVAPSGAAALASLRESPPALILLDVGLPDTTGFALCEQIKRDPALRHIPVIFLSAGDRPEAAQRGFDAGGADYITKPFQVAEVLARIETHLAVGRYQRELAARGRQLDAANERLRELERGREQLLRMMAHDLQAPLAALQERLEALAARASAPDDSRDLRTARLAGARIGAMVEDMVGLTRADRGGEVEIFDARAVLLEVARAASPPRKGPRIALTAPDDPTAVAADRGLVDRVLSSLVADALRHARGRVTLRLRSEDERALFDVIDDGPEMPAAVRAGLFEVQPGGPRPGAAAPRGAGLAFCKLAVEASGGEIRVATGPKGTAFRVILPLAPAAGSNPP